ncbi:MAG: glucoamylase family protein [Marinobacter sp.]|uniref:glucoamylase family protein n=1 Tax=Marinobacter sp. TaxID=50741 RepID=UPI003C604F72
MAGWLMPRVPGPPDDDGARSGGQINPLSALSLWKIFDNLRRSLVAPALLTLLLVGWLFSPGPLWPWTLFALAVVFLPTLIELVRKPDEFDWWIHLNLTCRSAGRPLVLAVLTLAFLPYDTRIGLGAIWRSGIRRLFTRRGLLLWQLPGYARRNASETLADYVREMWVAPLLALAPAGGLYLVGSDLNGWLATGPILLLWLGSPLIAWWISRPLATPSPDLTIEQQLFLRCAARRTWRYFADFVGPDDNWLPPDNYQVHPTPAIASRTSPTNIGMSLLADLAAVDFGYITVGNCLSRIDHTLAAMEQLERYRGHLFNWYDTRTLQPLHPQYVSSVDSGNLAGSLLTLHVGLAEMKHRSVVSLCALQGLQDTLKVCAEQLPESPVTRLADNVRMLQDTLRALTLAGAPRTLAAAISALEQIHRSGGALTALLPADVDRDGELAYWARAFDQQLHGLRAEIADLVPESWQGDEVPTRMALAEQGSLAARAQLDRIDGLMARCRDLAEMDFSFLYDAGCGLLTIGYDVSERRRDPACYDLLASEARLASFLLIAQGQLPQKHWFALGRSLTSHGGDVSLISWSGSMFEYLMPQLVMPSYPNTLLSQTCKAAVSRQIEYGRQRAVPWGISESCYNATDFDQVYQYRAFGVPGLGFKRGLGDDLVIAPYATALALTVMPREACRNLQTLAERRHRRHHAGVYRPGHPHTGSSSSFQRALSRNGHARRRKYQPLARSGGDPLARRRYL